MSTLKVQRNLSLKDVISRLEESSLVEHRGLLMAAEVIVSYLKQPAHEISIEIMKEKQRHFPLFLSSLRLSLDQIDHIVAEVSCLIKSAEGIEFAEKGQRLVTGLPPVIQPVFLSKNASTWEIDKNGERDTPDLEKEAA